MTSIGEVSPLDRNSIRPVSARSPARDGEINTGPAGQGMSILLERGNARMETKKLAFGALLGAPTIVAGSVYLTPAGNVYHRDYVLASDEALIIIPVENQEYADFATNLYLDPLGFDGTPTTLDMPEVIPGHTLDQAVNAGVQDLVTGVENEYNAGEIDANDPLYIFGLLTKLRRSRNG
jgi:hypothetical protein